MSFIDNEIHDMFPLNHTITLSKQTRSKSVRRDWHFTFPELIDSMMNEWKALPLSDSSNSNKTQVELLRHIVANNKCLIGEIRAQIRVIESLESGNARLTGNLCQIQKEVELFKQRDELNLKRNASLSRKNRILQEKLEDMAKQMVEMKTSFEKRASSIESSLEGKIHDAQRRNDALEIGGVVRESKMKKMRTNCQHLVEENRRMRKILRSIPESR